MSASAVVLAGYLTLLLGIGYWGWRRAQAGEEDYYLAGRGQGLAATALTIMATMFSSAALLGIPGVVYRDGLAFFAFALNLPLSGAAVYFIGDRVRRRAQARGHVTPGDLLSEHYGGSSAVRVLTALIGVLYVLPYIVMQLKAGGLLAQQLFADAEPWHVLGLELTVFDLGTGALSIVTMAYVLLGGMRSVAWSDVLQGLLLLTGMLVAGAATVSAMGGWSGYWAQVAELPHDALSTPGATGAYPWTKLWTLVLFASLATMVQPGQWMRYCAARSAATLRRTALIFATVLPACFLFGILLVALGARVLYPPGTTPHPKVGEVDQAAIVMIQEHVPAFVGPLGPWVVALILVAVLAASMSTADSNLHALSAVLTRDVHDRLRPKATDRQRTRFGRAVIVVATLAATWLVAKGRHDPNFRPLELIASLMFVAMAFSAQLLPAVVDALFLQRGSARGAAAGMACGVATVLLFTPFPKLLLGGVDALEPTLETLRGLLDLGLIGLVVNVAVFVAVHALGSWRSPRPRGG